RSGDGRTRTPMRRPRDSDVDLLIGTPAGPMTVGRGRFTRPSFPEKTGLPGTEHSFQRLRSTAPFIGRPRLRLVEDCANGQRRILWFHGRPPSSSRTGNGLRKPAQTRLRSWVASAGARTQTRAGPVPTAGALRG